MKIQELLQCLWQNEKRLIPAVLGFLGVSYTVTILIVCGLRSLSWWYGLFALLVTWAAIGIQIILGTSCCQRKPPAPAGDAEDENPFLISLDDDDDDV